VKDVVEQVDYWVARGDRVALATVVGVRRSAPRPPGSKMAVNDRGEVYGAVSGGCVEGAVVEVAEKVLAGGEPQLLSYGIADNEAWDVGLPCGGEIDVWVERYASVVRNRA
jgi:xanthine dehydrogenase accessory factor